MAQKNDPRPDSSADDFARHAETPQPNIVSEMLSWMRYNKKWWLLPIVSILLLVGLLVVVSGSAIAPFIYAIF